MIGNRIKRRNLIQTLSLAGAGIAGGAGMTSAQTETLTQDLDELLQGTSGPYEQQQKLTADDGDTGDKFGSSVVLSDDGTTALIGANLDENQNGDEAGSAYVFERSGGSWSEQQKLTADDGDAKDEFGWSVALSGDGTTALIGAFIDEDPNGPGGAGSAYVFEESGGSWSEQQKLSANDGDTNDIFGSSVALSEDGTTALIGAGYDEDPNGSQAGSAYVFERSGGSWTQQRKLIAGDGDTGDYFGLSVALSDDGTVALIGAEQDEDPNGGGAGSAYVFEESGGSWSQQQKLSADDGDTVDYFGWSVALSGDGTTALIGAYGDEDPNGGGKFGGAGSAYVFEESGGSWGEQQKLSADDGDETDDFGWSVALSGDGTMALIGAQGDENEAENGGDVGSAYVFEESGESWGQQQKLTADDGDTDQRFGHFVGLSEDGTMALISADDGDGPNGDTTGAAYAFSSDSGSENAPPTAEAGSDQTVSGGEFVTLDASGSSDPDGDDLSYSWTQTAGPDVSLSDADTATPSLTTPSVEEQTVLTFEVSVTDGTATDTDSVSITVEGDRPPALPGLDTIPQDIDDDGVYEDLDGDGELTLLDVQLYYQDLYLDRDSEYVQNYQEFFDLDGDGEITLADIQAVFEKRTD